MMMGRMDLFTSTMFFVSGSAGVKKGLRFRYLRVLAQSTL